MISGANNQQELIYKYVRGELSAQQREDFEAAFFADPELLALVEAELALYEGAQAAKETASITPITVAGRRNWHVPAALAACLVLALSASLAYRSNQTVKQLQQDLAELNRPYAPAEVIRLAPLRSASSAALKLRLPVQDTVMLLQVPASDLLSGTMTLSEQDTAQVVADWAVEADTRNQLTAAINSKQLNPGLYQLRIADDGAEKVAEYMLEFLPAQ